MKLSPHRTRFRATLHRRAVRSALRRCGSTKRSFSNFKINTGPCIATSSEGSPAEIHAHCEAVGDGTWNSGAAVSFKPIGNVADSNLHITSQSSNPCSLALAQTNPFKTTTTAATTAVHPVLKVWLLILRAHKT
eukprot:scaffold2998_cov239-Pinguiococcus_pyrenoidosus.AAC.3